MRHSFGRGIESLIPKKAAEKVQEKQEPIFYIEIEKIKSNPYQPRKNFDQDGLNALSDSVREYGILQPLLVSRLRKDSGITEYQLVAGERRLLAAKMVGLRQVPVIVRDPTEQEKLEISIIENVQRMDLNAMEKAEAYKRLQKEFSFTQSTIAKMVGKSRESVANTMRLLDLPEEARRALREERITEGHARAILAVDDPKNKTALLTKVIRDGISVREAESFTQKLRIWQPVRRTRGNLHEEKALEDKARDIFGMQSIRLKLESGQPRLTIFLDSTKALEELFRRIK
ncbi:MAG: ParB/RepB/Spo0J family partition protein [Candidatus Nealsonbacteria bacterium]|nr:ParB/RepB/Spo0J family partition protein [Candidatus Nealsonbacteria bacterium]